MFEFTIRLGFGRRQTCGDHADGPADDLRALHRKLDRILGMLHDSKEREKQTMLNTENLQAAIDTVAQEVTENGQAIAEAIDILNGTGDAQERINAATAKLTDAATALNSNEGSLRTAIDAANPSTPGGVNVPDGDAPVG